MTHNTSDRDSTLETLPPELEALHTRLERDGTRWRASLPPVDHLIERVTVASRRLVPPGSSRSHATTSAPGQFSGMYGHPPVTPGHLRGIVAVGMAVAIVALFAVLLRSFTGTSGRVGGTRSTPASTAAVSPSVALGRWVSVDGLKYSTQNATGTPVPPAISPTDPNTVYEASMPPVKIRRTTDGGKTWRELALPTGAAQATAVELYISPVRAQTVFVTVTASLEYSQSGSACPSLSGATGYAPSHGGIAAAGVVQCSQSYVSRDRGNTWTPLRFPVAGSISGRYSDYLGGTGAVIQSQDGRLYATLGCGTMCSGAQARLVRSDDGGLTWRVVDQGLQVCAYAAAPTGSTVFAAVAVTTCDPNTGNTLTLYQSEDRGASWQRRAPLESAVVSHMRANVLDGAPVLYMNVPTIKRVSRTFSEEYSPSEFIVSTDGGKTLQRAPATGIPDGVKPDPIQIAITRDGTLVGAFNVPGGTTLYAWKPGDTSWRQLSALLPGGQAGALMFTAPDGGPLIYWVLLQTGGTQDGNTYTFEYSIFKFEPLG